MANKLGKELEGKVVILSPKYYKGDENQRKFLCKGGFGCHSYTIGTAIFGHFLCDGEEARISGYDIEAIFEDVLAKE